MGDTAGDAGARGVLLSLPLGIAAAVYLLGFAKLEVDDRGEPLPINGSNGFRGLYLATREALTGQQVTPHKELGVEAIGTFWLLMVVIPLLVVLGVFVIFRFRRAQSTYWTVTIGMLLIAATVLLLGRIEYIGAMGALTWASFQIRRAELPGKMAEREAVRAARAEAAAAEAEEDDDEYDDDEAEYDEDEYEEEAEYDEDDDVEEDEDAEVEEDEAEEDDTVDEVEDDAEYVDEADDDVVDEDVAEDDDDGYDDDVLKELQAEIDESEGRSGSGGTKPGPR